MHFFTYITAVGMATLAVAAPSFEKRQALPQVTIFRDRNFQGQAQQFPADGSCVASSFDSFLSIDIPEVAGVWCDIYNNADCSDMYASIRSSVADIGFYGPTRIPKHVVCEVREVS